MNEGLEDAPWLTKEEDQDQTGSVEPTDQEDIPAQARNNAGDLPDAPWITKGGGAPTPDQQPEQLENAPWLEDAPWISKQPEPEGELAGYGRRFAHGIIPAIAAVPGAVAGAGVGIPGGVVGMFAGALAGGAGAAYLAETAQDWVGKAFGFDDSQQLAANAAAHPLGDFIAGLLPNLLTFTPGGGLQKAARATGAGLMGGVETAHEAYQGEGFDPAKIGAAGAMGAASIKPTRIGQVGIEIGEGIAASIKSKAGYFRPGRPGESTGSGMATPSAQNSGGLGTAPVEAPTPGRDPTAPGERNSPTRQYPKDQEPGAAIASPADVPEDLHAALSGKLAPVAAEAPKQEIPREPNAPTGLVEAAQEAGRPAPTAVPPGWKQAPDGSWVKDEQAPASAAPEQAAPAAQPTPERIETGLEAAGEPHPHLPQVRIVRTEPVKYLAGISEDGRTINIDPSVPREIDVNGIKLDPAHALAIHEVVEQAAIKKVLQGIEEGKVPPTSREEIYQNIHETVANRVERRYLEEHYGFDKEGGHEDWDRYQEIMADHARHTEKENVASLPKDLDTFPYQTGVARQGAIDATAAESPPTGPARTGRVLEDLRGQEVTAPVTDQAAIAKQRLENRIAAGGTELMSPKEVRAARGEPEPVKNAVGQRPRVIEQAVAEARARGMSEEAIKAIEADPFTADLALRQFANKTGNAKPRESIVARVPSKAAEVEGAEVPVTARSKADAAAKGQALAAAKAAYEKFTPENDQVPVAKADIAKLKDRLEQALQHAKEQNEGNAQYDNPLAYKPQKKSAGLQFLKAAQRFVDGPQTPKQAANFAATERDIRAGNVREAQAVNRVEADIGRQKRPTGEQAELAAAERARPSEVEDEAIARIDAQRAAERGEVPEEPAPAPRTPKVVEAGPLKEAKPEALAKLVVEPIAELKTDTGRKVALTPEVQAAALAALEKAEARAQSQKAPRPTAAEKDPDAVAKPKREGPMTLIERFAKDEGGAGPVPAMPSFLRAFLTPQGGFSNTKLGRFAARFKPSEDYISRTPQTDEERYARSLSNDLFALGQRNANDGNGNLNKIYNMPKDYRAPDGVVQTRVYLALDNDLRNGLTMPEQLNTKIHLDPVMKDNSNVYKRLRDRIPDLPEELGSHLHRMPELYNEKYDPNATGDPIIPKDRMLNTKTSSMYDRPFMGLERMSDGKRMVTTHDPLDGKLTIWSKGSAHVYDAPAGFINKEGNTLTTAAGDWKVVQATTSEIEANGRFEPKPGQTVGPMAKYYKNAIVSVFETNKNLHEVERTLDYIQNLKEDPRWQYLASKDPAKEKEGWYKTALKKDFDGWYMHPQLARMLDDFALAGMTNDYALGAARKLSSSITKLMFWAPTIHLMNVLTHWGILRGVDWVPYANKIPIGGGEHLSELSEGGWHSLYDTGRQAIKSVITQDETYKKWSDAGGGLVYGRIRGEDMHRFAKAAGLQIQKNHSDWDPIAKATGYSVPEIANAIYNTSRDIMWAGNDMMLLQAYLEGERKGLTVPQAITRAEKQIPNYRLPTSIMGTGNVGRGLSKVLGDTLAVAFGRYHYQIANGLSHTTKDLAGGTKRERLDALGHVMVMGLLAYVLKPVGDAAVQALTNDPSAEVPPRGPMVLLSHAHKVYQNKEDYAAGARGMVTVSPFLNAILNAISNKDFAGHTVVQPGSGAGHNVVQFAEQRARDLISPYGTLATAYHKGQNPLVGVRDTALGIQTKSPAAQGYEARAEVLNQKKAMQRMKKPPGMAEDIYNRLQRLRPSQ